MSDLEDQDVPSSDENSELDAESSDDTNLGTEINDEEAEEKVNVLDAVEKSEKAVDQIISTTANLSPKFFNLLTNPLYQDISALFSEGVPFFVDIDGILMMVLADNQFNKQLAGSSLHIAYILEDFLNVFIERGGIFHLLFFRTWTQVWEQHSELLLYRKTLIEHFRKNSPYQVHEFDNVLDNGYKNLVSTYRPQFLLTNFEIQPLFKMETTQTARNICYWQILYTLKIGLPCADCNYVDTDIFNLNAFYSDVSTPIVTLIRKCHNRMQSALAVPSRDVDDIDLRSVPEAEFSNVRTLVTILAAKCFIQNYIETETSKEMLKIFILTTVFIDTLQIENRSVPKLREKVVKLRNGDLRNWFICLHNALVRIENVETNWGSVTDLWQGLLYGHLCRFLSRIVVNANQLGEIIAAKYERLIKVSEIDLEPYPITSVFDIQWLEYNNQTENLGDTTLLNIDSPLFREFCQSVMHNITWRPPANNVANSWEYTEERHYHSMKVISDEYDRIKNTIEPVPTDPRERRWYFKNRDRHAKYMTVYGSSLEGNILTCEGIVRASDKDSKKKEKKMGKKALEIIEKNKNKKLSGQVKKEMDMLTDFETNYKNPSKSSEALLSSLNTVITKIQTPPKMAEAMLWKVKILLRIFRNTKNKGEGKKDLFLIIRDLLSLRDKENINFDASQKELLCKALGEIDCLEIARRNKLFGEKVSVVDNNWVEYQLRELGPELERVTDGSVDSRARGFIPDKWQRDLFNIVDKRQSAVIVAPTSSGKTYASYYCMESILKEGTEGIVVYVSPTKALVNQVAATVYARFKNTNMPPGQSVYGVFTRDFRTHATNCQILITVPQCLELLLMSPRQYAWVKRVRYVIFDEVHCIAGNIGGIFWERCLMLIRCPFLALSATIRHPQQLHSWLQDVESFKHSRDIALGDARPSESYRVRLVIHSERHSDLTKYTFQNDSFNHLHPYGNLEPEVMKAHDGIPSHMYLSPAETLQLYHTMKAEDSSDERLLLFDPCIYFSQKSENGFLTRNMVRIYEKELSSLLSSWFRENPDRFDNVIERLKAENESDEIIEQNDIRYVCMNVIEVIKMLKDKNMLPAIVFSYNRGLIVKMMKIVTNYLKQNDEQIDRRLQKKLDKEEKMQKKAKEREDKESKNNSSMVRRKRLVRGPQTVNILEKGANSLRDAGNVDAEDLKFIERRLARMYKPNNIYMEALRHGVGVHHSGLNNKLRNAVEMLFRMRVLNIVFATGTLALGIHMPCKTVVVAGNSPYLNSLEYHQMSGRAGRRGYDTAGNVIFFGLNQRKQHTLLTAHLPIIQGIFPLHVTFVLRLLLLVSDVTDRGKTSEQATKMTLSRVMTLLENSLIYKQKPRMKDQVKHFFGFSMQFLIMQEYIDGNGVPLKWCGLVSHLHYHEPGNFAFVYLLRTGVIRQICTANESDEDIQYKLVLILCYLFTKRPIREKDDVKYDNSLVDLDPLPMEVENAIKIYNREVNYVFNQYFMNVAMHCSDRDNHLPLSKVEITSTECVNHIAEPIDSLHRRFLNLSQPTIICSSFAALSGNNDKNNLQSKHKVINSIKKDICSDIKVVPIVDLEFERNGYALDFYRHGMASAIVNDNGLKEGEDFTSLQDFMMIIKVIRVSLEEMQLIAGVNDPVYRQFNKLDVKYQELFRAGYPGYNY